MQRTQFRIGTISNETLEKMFVTLQNGSIEKINVSATQKTNKAIVSGAVFTFSKIVVLFSINLNRRPWHK